jgi:multisubunit Na+/H+ antiporter MnhF subunit
MSLSSREQLMAFLALVVAVLMIALAPVVVAGLLGKNLPDALIAVSDKTVTGLVGVLGTIAAMIFRTNKLDEQRADNTAKAFDAVTAAAQAGSPTTPQPVVVTNDATAPVPVENKDA